MDDAYFEKLVEKLDAEAGKDKGLDELFKRAEKRCKELYPNHEFVDIFADPSIMDRIKKRCKKLYPNRDFVDILADPSIMDKIETGLKPMEKILKGDGGWDDALKRFACHPVYSEMICRVAIPATGQ